MTGATNAYQTTGTCPKHGCGAVADVFFFGTARQRKQLVSCSSCGHTQQWSMSEAAYQRRTVALPRTNEQSQGES